MSIEELRTELETALREAIGPVVVRQTFLTEDLDHEGRPTLNLRVVYDDHAPAPTGAQMLDIYDVINPLLEEAGETRFPLMTFVASSEAGEEAA